MLSSLAADTIILLSSDWFFLAVIALLYWVIDKHTAFKLLVIFALTLYVHEVLINSFPAGTQATNNHESFLDPAKEVQLVTAFWGFLIPAVSDRRFTILSCAIISFTAVFAFFNNSYSYQDIVAALFLGVFIVFIVYRTIDWIGGVPEPIVFSFSLVLPSALLLLFSEGAVYSGLLLGVGAGYSLEKIKNRVKVSGTAVKKTAAGLLGLTGLILIASIGKWLPDTTLIQFSLAAFLGLWITFIQPFIAVTFDLYDREEDFLSS
ncbi:hypothetical protein [Bacillus piscicola]|uniref:hypothetical protein n=1 Tax=Bacillus piscicola TaxID=1632684 RepID=UPI001F095C74|nr:hypothetical protein [Bacillus piscicola]